MPLRKSNFSVSLELCFQSSSQLYNLWRFSFLYCENTATSYQRARSGHMMIKRKWKTMAGVNLGILEIKSYQAIEFRHFFSIAVLATLWSAFLIIILAVLSLWKVLQLQTLLCISCLKFAHVDFKAVHIFLLGFKTLATLVHWNSF